MLMNSLLNKPLIIAEIGANHNGDMTLAKELIDQAKLSGADAVKFQSWGIDSIESRMNYEMNHNYNDKKKHFGSLYEMVNEYSLTVENHIELANYCKEHEIFFLSTPFTIEEVDLLNDLGVPLFKVASMDIDNFWLLEHIAKTGKPILLSTGMSSLKEIIEAVEFIESNNCKEIVILHCVSLYPTSEEKVNLNNISLLKNVFPNLTIGFSDHTLGLSASVGAVALGAMVVEKHFTINKDLPGWDHSISADPKEFSEMATNINNVFRQLGSYHRVISEEETIKKIAFRRSAFSKRKLLKGQVIIDSDITFKRPGGYISPAEVKYLVGRKLNKTLDEGDLIKWEDLE